MTENRFRWLVLKAFCFLIGNWFSARRPGRNETIAELEKAAADLERDGL